MRRLRLVQIALCGALLAGISFPAGGPSHVVAQSPAPSPAPTPKPDDTPAKAVVTLHDGRPVPETWKLGFSVPLSAAKSDAGSKEQSVRWYIDPPDFDQYCVRRDNGRSIDVQTGVEPVKLRIRLAVAKGDTFDETTVEIQAGQPRPVPPPRPPPDPSPTPTPTPNPTPQPTPGPAPADVFGKLGYDFAGQVIKGYADTMDESASMLAAGVSRKAVIADFEKRWKARRDKASAASAAEFAKIVADDKEPVGEQKNVLAEAWRQYAKGVSSR